MPLITQQFRLLLWKDYLIRKRKLITLAGVIWATLVISSLYIVRSNVENYDFPTCQFQARALPSAGMLNFIQSFMCTVDNQCSPLDQYQQIPTYGDSKFTRLQRRLSPILNNDTILDTVDSVPSALKLVGSLSRAADEPIFISIAKDGLRIRDLFRDYFKAHNILMKELGLSIPETDSLMEAEISLKGILKGKLDLCTLSDTILADDIDTLMTLSNKTCKMEKKEMQELFVKLIVEIDIEKYLNMLGTMYRNLNGDQRLLQLSDMLSAVLRISKLDSFLPKEISAMLMKSQEEGFRYFDLGIIPKLILIFEPTFGETESYKLAKTFADTSVGALQWLYNILQKNNISSLQETSKIALTNIRGYKDLSFQLDKVSRSINSAFELIKSSIKESLSLDEAFVILSKATNFLLKFVSQDRKHEILFYSTLLAKMVEGAHDVVFKNLNMERIIFNVSKEHQDGVRMFVELPSDVRMNAVHGLMDADRAFALTSKLNKPSQMFCDEKRLAVFFKLPANKIAELKQTFCNDVWNSYISDLITSFGIYNVNQYINSMASLLIQETLGKDTSDQLYSPEDIFKTIQELVEDLLKIQDDGEPLDWGVLLGNHTDVVMEFGKRKTMGKEILITVHGAMARKIVQENIILDMKLSPILKQISYFVKTMIDQINIPDKAVLGIFNQNYPRVIEKVLMTSFDEDKTYNLLSWSGIDLYCHARQNFTNILTFPDSVNQDNLTSVMCKFSIEMDKSIKAEGFLTNTIKNIDSKIVTSTPLDWSKLINNLRILYSDLYDNYPYLFEPTSFNMDKDTSRRITELMEESRRFWFESSLEKSLHLGIKGAFFALDLLDPTLDAIQPNIWKNVKHRLNAANGPIVIIDEIAKIAIAVMGGADQSSVKSGLPPVTTSALKNIIPNIGQFVIDAVKVVETGNTSLEPIIEILNSSPLWPCSNTSLAETLDVSDKSKMAIRNIEIMFCFNDTLKEEWMNYEEAQKAKKLIEKSNSNITTEFKEHFFLRMSRNFDELVKDTTALQTILNDLPEDSGASIFDVVDTVMRLMRSEDRNDVLRDFFTKLDTVLVSINTSEPRPVSLNILWEDYNKCNSSRTGDTSCQEFARTVWVHNLEFFSVMADSMAGDLIRYFTENNEPNANILQMVGFTRNTGLYLLYEKFVDFVGVLLNSYWDFGFMNQVRKESRTTFWDCESIVDSLVIPQDSMITPAHLNRVKPYICASLLHWVSLPSGENTLLDVIARPQYYFYTMQASNLTSTYNNAFTKIIELTDILANIANKNVTQVIKNENENFISFKDKLNAFADNITKFKIDETDSSYKLFNEINKKQFISSIYLTRIIIIITRIQAQFEQLNFMEIDKNETIEKQLKTDLGIILKKLRRRPTEAIALHFDIITNSIWKKENYSLVESIENLCGEMNKSNHKFILAEDKRFLAQICAKSYKRLYGELQDLLNDDFNLAKEALMKLIQVLDNSEIVDDIFKYMAQKTELIRIWSQSIKHADETGIPLYLQYLETTLNHYDVILEFLSGNNWWKSLRSLYQGPYANTFFKTIENSFKIFDGMINGLDKVKLSKLLYEINYNDTEALCKEDIHLSDYIPDGTGTLDALKTQICSTDEDQLYLELPLMNIVAQVYNGDIITTKNINYTAIESLLSNIQQGLQQVESGPKSPSTPDWITTDDLEIMKRDIKRLLSKETLIKTGFGAMENIVDAVTLYFNKDCKCTPCCAMTGWLKQLNLQLYKKQEYDSLLCNLDDMTDEEIYDSLNADFHWDMSVQELLATRNYTSLELNRSVNELLGLIKLFILEDVSTYNYKLSDCLNKNVSSNHIGNFTLFLSTAAKTLKLLKIQLPHLQEIPGFKQHEFWSNLYKQLAPKLRVLLPFSEIADGEAMSVFEGISEDAMKTVKQSQVDLYSLTKSPDLLNEWLIIPANESADFCIKYNCTAISDVVYSVIDKQHHQKQLESLQTIEFWSLSFLTSLVQGIESTLTHVTRVGGLLSRVDVVGALRGELVPVLDAVMQLLMDSSVDDITYSLQGLVKELYPLLKGTHLDEDLLALTHGLEIFKEMKRYVVENIDLKLKVSDIFLNKELIENELREIGINDTAFWTTAAPRIHDGYIDLKPLFTPTVEEFHISSYICDPDYLTLVMKPLDVVPVDLYQTVIHQFCGLHHEDTKLMINVLVQNVNGSYVMDKLFNFILSQILSSSAISQEDGARLLSRLPTLMELLPTVQQQFKVLSYMFKNEPVFAALKDFKSVGGLLKSSEFMSSAGTMLCGTPFKGMTNRILKAVLKSKDFSTEPDKEQLDALPTDFCRSIYTDILSMDGGKIVWSFIKPLLMGKLLYTPNTEAVENIIRQANSTFTSMSHMFNLVDSLSESFSGVEDVQHHQAGAEALVSLLPLVLEQPSVSDPVSISEVLEQLGDVQDLKALITKVAALLKCLNLNRFIPMEDEFTLAHQAVNLTRINEFSAGIVFMNVSEQDGRPYNVEYKIRMDIDTVPTTAKLRNQLWIPGPEASFLEDMRYFRGFVQVQDLIDRAVIQLAGPTGLAGQKWDKDIRNKRDINIGAEDWGVYTQQMPYPCYKKDYFQTSLYESQALVVALFFSLLFTVCSAIRFNVSEKESGNTMLMSVMGVKLSAHTLSWFVASFTELILTCVCITAVLYFGNILPRTDISLLLAVTINYGFSVLMFCYVITRISSSASLSAVSGGLAVMISFMPFVLVLAMEVALTDIHKLLTSLSMSSAFAYSIYQMTKLEAVGVGAHWSTLWETREDHISLGVTMLMVTFDAVLYLTIGYLVDLLWGPGEIRSNIVRTSSREKSGVSVVEVGVEFGGGRGLKGVSLDLNAGCVTALLGHNGAGKTTLIKVITGELRPTSGHVSLMTSEGSDVTLGVCPQQDILYPNLTVDEHLNLYAQLKSGNTLEECQEDIQYIRSVLHLGGRSSMETRHLSGGERRRVCVSLSFLARPRLVLLDEPTTGVDPAARRDIWSMIEKLREDRTILLTTHHLDEAELLSDQIVIMHKGQVHTVGTPVEIKRSLGTGYKLSVTFPQPPLKGAADRVVEFVRRVVLNAHLHHQSGPTVHLGLPFYDLHGLNTDYLELCELLESKREELGFTKFEMDCCSLEQVLYNICAGVDQSEDQELASSSSNTSVTSSSNDSPSKCSVRSDDAALVSGGAISGSNLVQFGAILHKRLIHYYRNKWLWWVVAGLPTLFLLIAMSFSTIRPPPDLERPLHLTPQLYHHTTSFVVPYPFILSDDIPIKFGDDVMSILKNSQSNRYWTPWDNPTCVCEDAHQTCDWSSYNVSRPDMMVLPDEDTANDWIVTTHEEYIEKRYTGFSSCLINSRTVFIAWYNNKGHHALPSAINAVNSAILKRKAARPDAGIKAYSHPLKISTEQLSKTTIYQHIADAGISALVLLSYSLIPSGAAAYLVLERKSRQKTLQMLCGVSPAVYWGAAVLADIVVIVINIGITACVMAAFGFPVFVARDNLPAICLLLFLFGFACNSLVHISEKMFSEPSMSTMVVFCGNVFVGLSGMAVLLILDLISESDMTDHVRWVLHKIFMLSPQFVLGDALIEVAKNTVQAQVLERFGMDTYNSPLSGDVISLHYAALALVGALLTALNLIIEYRLFDYIADRWCNSKASNTNDNLKDEGPDIVEERKRVMNQLQDQLTIPTIHNIHKGPPGDVCMLVRASRAYRKRVALQQLTLGFPRGQCTCVLGENGAGKSTTFSLLSGERTPTEGEVRLQLVTANKGLLHQGRISYCPQTDAIDMLLTVRETLIFYCKLRGIENVNDVVNRTLELFELSKYSSVRSGSLSGGNKRKLCTAVAFMGRTELVLLDEPTSGMDPASRACVARGTSVALQGGRGVVLSTHALQDAHTLAHRVAVLHRGRLVAVGTVQDCLTRFGGGYIVSAVGGDVRGAWTAVEGRGARLRALHARNLQFIMPIRIAGKADDLKLSEVFRLMAELQSRYDIEDYTINQSTLDEMFLNSSTRAQTDISLNIEDIEEAARLKNKQIEEFTPL